jgi:Holliday junction resolvase RusA-like endonuclease
MKIVLGYPPSTNAAWRAMYNKHIGRVVVFMTKEAREYKKNVANRALAAGARPLEGDVTLCVKVFRPMRRGDLMDREKVLCDALQGVAYMNDSQIRRAEFELFDDKDNPRVEVEVEPYRVLMTLED